MDLIWLIPVLPGVGAALNGILGVRYFSKTVAAGIACATMGGSLLLSVFAFVQLLGAEHREHVVSLGDWIPPIPLQTVNGLGAFEVPWAFRLDPLSGMMILIVTGIGFLIHLYSSAYMHHEPRGGYVRFFCYLNLFCCFMLTLVLGSTFLVMFVGWEGVGLCSYLLIGFWYHKKSAADAGKKAFVVNRVGDFGFVLGVFLIFFTFGTLDFREVAEAAAQLPVETATFGVLSTICLLLFIGAVGKSAQIPLYVWLPDGRPERGVVFAGADDHDDRSDGRGGDGSDGGYDRTGSNRHQKGSGVLDCFAARLHVFGDRRGCVCGRGVSPDDPRLL